MLFGSRFQWEIFVASVRNRIRLRYETNNEFPRHNSGSTRHCGLSQSVLLGAGSPLAGGMFLSENAFVSRSGGT